MEFNFLAAANIMDNPGIIIGPISWVLGHVLNFFFNIVYSLTTNGSLGISIIFMTLFTRSLMIPFAVKQQKSMFLMQKLQPEIQKIQDKYKNKKDDPEIQKKITMETQKLYSKHNYSPFSGCLPMLIQLPIFLGLYHIMRNPFQYINEINSLYSGISNVVLEMAGNNADVRAMVMEFGKIAGLVKDTNIDVDVFNRILNILDPTQVNALITATGDSNLVQISQTKNLIENFCGINLTETVGLGFNLKLLIPILSGGTTFLSTWLMTRRNKNTDPAMQTQQRVMNITMPLFMAWVTTSIPAGVGIYWITQNIYMMIQQWAFNLYYSKKLDDENVVDEKKGGKK